MQKKTENKKYDHTVYQSLTMILQFGINMIVPIAMMTALGVYLDRKLMTSWITVVCFFLGAAAGGQNVYRMAKKVFDTPDQSRKPVSPGMEQIGEKTAGKKEKDRK